jgi:hypothetical protein
MEPVKPITALGKRIAEAAREVAAHLRGETALKAYTVPGVIESS